MTTWLDPLIGCLDASDEPVTFFFRDDDAGWDDAALLRLLDVFESRAAPIDLAAIPAALGALIVAELSPRLERRAIGLHQHGWTHTDHQRHDRKCEFGPDCDRRDQYDDIAAGRTRLLDRFGAVEPMFTPPWNRCTDATADCLVELGLAVLSRDVGAHPFGRPDLIELPVSVDWFAHRKGVRVAPGELGALLATCALRGGPVGVMLHHAVSTANDLGAIGQLLTRLVAHPNARIELMRSIVGKSVAPIPAR